MAAALLVGLLPSCGDAPAPPRASVPVTLATPGSLRPVLEGQTPADWRTSVYYHYFEPPGGHNIAPHYGVRTDRYKLIRYYDSTYGGDPAWELLDLGGRTVKQGQFSSANDRILVEDLVDGVYLFRSDAGTERLVIQY